MSLARHSAWHPRCAVAVMTLLLATLQALAGEGEEIAGLLLEVRGSCSVTTTQGVTERATAGRQLFVRERMQCKGGGSLRAQLGCSMRTLDAEVAPLTVAWSTSPLKCDEKLLREILRDYGETGGRRRGSAELVYSPSARQMVAASLAVIRWQPQQAAKLRFSLIERGTRNAAGPDEVVLWQSAPIDASLGALDAPELRAQLAATRESNPSARLYLTVSGTGSGLTIPIRLLAHAEEQELTGSLHAVEALSSDPLLRHIGRAAVLKRFDLYAEAAAEYEAALREAPESAELRKQAIEMNGYTGNLARMQELERRN